MKTDECITGVVIESYTHDKHQVVTARCPDDLRMLHFFYLPGHPDINLGDTLIMNFHLERFWVHHGNPHLTYRILPCVFPDTLLLELILDRINN